MRGAVIPVGNMLVAPELIEVAAVLKQLTELWWWLTELSGLTDQGNVLAPVGGKSWDVIRLFRLISLIEGYHCIP